MSIESVMSRIAEIQTALNPPAPQPPAAPAASFQAQLQQAMGPGAAPATAPTAGGVPAAPGTYPHLDGDLDGNPELLRRLEALAAQRGEKFHITSGLRTVAEQQRLWDNRHSNPFPVARPGTSNHHDGNAADVTVNGQPIQNVISAAELRAAGLAPLAGDAVHVELPGA